MVKKRIMALDIGDKRIGIAVSDPTLTIASPLPVYTRKDLRKDIEHIKKICEDLDIGTIVVGLPLLLSGKEGTQASKVRRFVQEMKFLNVQIEFWDERFSTEQAMEILKGRAPRKKKEKKDSLSAAIILEEYMREKIEKGS